jgi:hypothetical protein
MQSEGQERATGPFLLNHQSHVGSGFGWIGEVQSEIIALMFAQGTPRQIFNPRDAVAIIIACEAASERSVAD